MISRRRLRAECGLADAPYRLSLVVTEQSVRRPPARRRRQMRQGLTVVVFRDRVQRSRRQGTRAPAVCWGGVVSRCVPSADLRWGSRMSRGPGAGVSRGGCICLGAPARASPMQLSTSQCSLKPARSVMGAFGAWQLTKTHSFQHNISCGTRFHCIRVHITDSYLGACSTLLLCPHRAQPRLFEDL